MIGDESFSERADIVILEKIICFIASPYFLKVLSGPAAAVQVDLQGMSSLLLHRLLQIPCIFSS